MGRKLTVFAIVLFAVCFLSASAFGATIFVNVANAGDTGQNGTSSHPFAKIQQGIDAASSGDTVQVAAGTYVENVDLNKSGIVLQGSNRNSIIDGNYGYSPVIYCRNLDGAQTTITGFYITNSYYGIECAGTTKNILIENNEISYNRYEVFGYGIYLKNGASAKIKNNKLTRSAKCVYAEGKNSIEITGNYFYYCRGSYGAGIYLNDSNALIKDNNMMENWDGSINIGNNSNVTIINTRITNSNGWGNAGGINVWDSNVEIRNSLIANSHSFQSNMGGGIYALRSKFSLFNNVFYGNSGYADSVNGAALAVMDTNLTAKNNIFNKNSYANAVIYFYDSGSYDIATQDFSYNDINDNSTINSTVGITLGEGNIFSDPQFVDTQNFYLKAISPSRNSGDPNPVFNDKDGTRNDMGMHGGPDGDMGAIQPACYTNSDCGTNVWVGTPFCQNGNVYQNYKTFTCKNPGQENASCTNNTTAQLKETCSNGCNNGACVREPGYWVTLDEHDTPLPTEGYYYNYTGGDRGLLNAEDVNYKWDSDSIYAAKVTHIAPGAQWTWGGMWYSLIKITRDNIPLDFKAIFGPYVNQQYQGEISEVEIAVNNFSSTSNNTDLELRLELKDKDDGKVCSKSWNLSSEQYPKTFTWILPEECKQKVKIVLWVLDKAQVGDSVSVDRIWLKAKVPDSAELPTEEQAFLWTYSWLMANYDANSGMVQDRSNFGTGDFENITATAKAAKNAYYAYRKGYTTYENAKAIITKIADTFINTVPTGPNGINSLWPHFTRKGGTEALPPHDGFLGTEWASGDTAYAALDIITALQMLGDPQNQISELTGFLQEIDWNAMMLENGGISHGYTYEGALIPYSWKGFGMETIGVNWVYASVTGNIAEMGAPPSDNGSGFIDNAAYPLVFTGQDIWNNDWDSYRSNMADSQIGWYCSHGNQYLCNANLFGLSAAETPGEDSYAAYGVGGKYSEHEDGDSEVIVLHYSAMISDIRLEEAKHVWETLRDRSAAFLQDTIVISPLNNMESMRVSKETGKSTIKHLKGSWNLALQAEGWALSDPSIRSDLKSAVMNNAFLKKGYNLLKPGVECQNNSDCGTDGFAGAPYCQSGNVYQNYKTFTCNNPGQQNASCTNNTTAQLKQTCQYSCSNGECDSVSETRIIWEFNNFENYYKVFKSYTCDVTSTKACPSELGWQGTTIKFKFNLAQTSDLPDALKFKFNVGYLISSKPVDISAGKTVKKIASNILVDRTGEFSVEVPKAVFSTGTNYVQITIKNVKTGYGRPSQGFVLDNAKLETDRNYSKPLLNCPADPINQNYSFSWQPNDYNGSRYYLQIGNNGDFIKKSYLQITTKTNPQPILKNFTSIKRLSVNSQDGKMYSRLYVTDTLKGTIKSNVCEIEIQ